MLRICELLDQLHSEGFSHGDLTLHNAMVTWEKGIASPVLIDLAGSADISSLPEAQRLMQINDDFAELYRELVLSQFFLGPLPHVHARKSLRRIDELFPDHVLTRLKHDLGELPSDFNDLT